MTNDSEAAVTLDQLQRIQAAFDRQHGFEFASAATGHDLARSVFASLALCGEVGELANQIKKAQRSAWLGEDPAEHIARAKLEVGGILAYLLKLSNELDLSLDETYLTTLSDNWLRFPVRNHQATGRVVCIAGPSGSGKSSVVKRLATAGVSTYVEDVAGNPYLKGVYARSPSFDARASQRWFLAQIADFVERSNDSSTLLMDQDPAAEVRVYAHLMREDELLSRDAYVELLTTLAALESRLGSRQQRVTIYLDADEVTLRARMIARGDREVPTEAWLRRVRMSFAELSDRNRNSRLVRTEGRMSTR